MTDQDQYDVLAAKATITLTAEPEDQPVTECFCCGDTDPKTLAYEAIENAKIAARLEQGDVWAWAIVRVTASVRVGTVTFTESAYIGGCSYDSEEDFRADGLSDLETDAREGLANQLRDTGTAFHKLEQCTMILFQGFEVSVFRSVADEVVTVQILTHDATGRDVFPGGHDIPRLRIIVNDSAETLDASGDWQGEDS